MASLWQTICADPLALVARWFFLIPAAVLLLSASAAVVMRNLIHAALLATASFVALGVAFISLGAEFVGFVQLLVYVGAVAMLIVFAILLTNPERLAKSRGVFSGIGPASGLLISFALLAVMLAFIAMSPDGQTPLADKAPQTTIATIGQALMGEYVVVFIVLGVLLTAALVGAAVIAMEDPER